MSATHAAAGSAARPDKLSPCPNSPNCVSSQSTDEAHFIEPLHYSGSTAGARQKLIDILEGMNRVRLAKVETDYIHAEFRSSVFPLLAKAITTLGQTAGGWSDCGKHLKNWENNQRSGPGFRFRPGNLL